MRQCLYIHGLNSSGNSHKAGLLAAHIARYKLPIHLHSPDLAATPAAALAQLQQLIRQLAPARPALVGSSLGGFYATCLAEQFDLQALLINPVVEPAGLFEAFLGPQYNPYTGEHYQLTRQHLQEVARVTPAQLRHPGNYRVLLGQQDEVLDYRRAEAFYRGCQLELIADDDHQLTGFEKHIAAGLAFLFPREE